eukprot:CAMPEP_0168230780 /NCGR_PEP_ID=MMETSP0140_2-20121125/16201_1 /TAXON_ID=44445 /ORGANISM="Pseudo-nitzschia australis, Strain 10249 10 AB" /LENGTH=62 /DNA_ID=CAMNT_0008163101 /DNA_START=1076 /DNA_END=1264 /DNA_ORIENTATION=-
MDNHDKISPEKQAAIEGVFHKAFEDIHRDQDEIYLSVRQIVAAGEIEEDGDPQNDAQVDFID